MTQWKNDTYLFDATKITNIDKLLEFGWHAFEAGQYYISIDCYNQAIRVDNRCEKAYIQRARCRLLLNDGEGAVRDLRKAWNINQNCAETYHFLGYYLFGDNRFKEAIWFYDQVIELNKEYVGEAHFNKAVALSKLGEVDSVIQECNLALEGYVHKLLPLSLRGATYIKKEMLKEALDDLTNAVELNPNDHFSLINKGHALLLLRRHKEALEVLDHLESVTGEQFNISGLKGIGELLQGNQTKAVFEFSKGIGLDETNRSLYSLRGSVKVMLENYLGAELDFQKAVNLDPNNGEDYLKLGKIQLKLKKVAEACLSFNRAGDLGCKEAYDEIKEHCKQ
jgi:tetratricopeptide (TPR) repeat protein